MTNQRYKKIQYIIRRLNHHMQICDELHDEETTQRQNYGANMEDEIQECKLNESLMMSAQSKIQDAIHALKHIQP